MPIVIFASGDGSNAEALMRFAQANPNLVSVRALVSDRAQARALERARLLGVAAIHLPHRETEKLLALLSELKPQWACLAGYMRILPKQVIDFFYDRGLGFARILNIHPSLLPAFPGLGAYEQAFSAGVPESGITVHIVDEKMDNGPIVLQRKFAREASDTLEQFTARGKTIEHQIFVDALRAVASGGFQVKPQAGNGGGKA